MFVIQCIWIETNNENKKLTEIISYQQITATDDLGQGNNATATIQINITDVNDEKPYFNSSSGEIFLSVPEDAKPHTVIGTLVATDNDPSGADLIYSVNDTKTFLIDPRSGR